MRRGTWLLGALIVAATVVAILALPRAAAVAVAVIDLALAVMIARATAGRTPEPRDNDEPDNAARGPTGELATMLDQLGEGVLLVDAEERVLLANEEAARILGRPRREIEGVTLIRAALGYELLQVLRDARGAVTDVSLGDERFIQASAARVDAGDVRVVLTVRDLTRLRRAERARGDLIANLSHELRTPITAARAIAETLAEGVDDARQRERFHAQLDEQIDRLADIVERLLRLSRIESQAEAFDVTNVQVPSLLAEAVERITPVASQRRLEVTIGPAVSAEVVADRERALEVLSNLLYNAAQHSPEGGRIRLEAHAEADAVRFEVIDDGPGVLRSERERVFERFYTGDQARSGGGGTGLGLAIAKHIVTRLDGRIWVMERTPGATFAFTLPRAGGSGDGSEPA